MSLNQIFIRNKYEAEIDRERKCMRNMMKRRNESKIFQVSLKSIKKDKVKERKRQISKQHESANRKQKESYNTANRNNQKKKKITSSGKNISDGTNTRNVTYSRLGAIYINSQTIYTHDNNYFSFL